MDTVQLEQLIILQNPHWQDKFQDNISLQIRREVFDEIINNFLKNRFILVINGLRRVGKSYLVKQILYKLLSLGEVPKKNLFYFQFSAVDNSKNFISKILSLYLSKYALSGSKIYIFLDEVQFVDYWQDQVKLLYDQNNNIKFIVTGSTSLFYKQKSKESLLGRIIKINLGVLSFREYLMFKNVNTQKFIGFEIDKYNRVSFLTNLDIYRTEFRNYLSYGQFPEVVINEATVNPKLYLDSLNDQLINYDIPYLYKKLDGALFTNLIKSLSFSLANQFSANKIAKELETDRRTVGEYLKILENVGLFSICLNTYFKSVRQKLSSVKKVYSLNTNVSLNINGFDPSYFNDNRVFGQYFENYAFLRLKNLYQGVEYYQSRTGELDFITQEFAFEVKSGEIKGQEKYVSISKKINKKLIFITESELSEEENYINFPIYLL